MRSTKFLLGVPMVLVVMTAWSGCAKSIRQRPADAREAPSPAAPRSTPRIERCDAPQEILAAAQEAGHPGSGALLTEIARCESQMSCGIRTVSPNGKYHGPYQFAPASWRQLCEPVFARLRTQDCGSSESIYDLRCSTICAADVISRGGIGNWPRCGPKAKRKLRKTRHLSKTHTPHRF